MSAFPDHYSEVEIPEEYRAVFAENNNEQHLGLLQAYVLDVLGYYSPAETDFSPEEIYDRMWGDFSGYCDRGKAAYMKEFYQEYGLMDSLQATHPEYVDENDPCYTGEIDWDDIVSYMENWMVFAQSYDDEDSYLVFFKN